MNRPTTRNRHLAPVPDYKPTIRDRLDDAGVTPLRALGAGAMVLLLGGGTFLYGRQIVKADHGPRDPRTELNQDHERNLIAPLFNANNQPVLPFEREGQTVSQFNGRVTINKVPATGLENVQWNLNLRTTPEMQDEQDGVSGSESNATIRVGAPYEPDDIRDADTVELSNPLIVTKADGTVFYGGLIVKPGDEAPSVQSFGGADDFASQMYWVNITGMKEQYSGATVDQRAWTSDELHDNKMLSAQGDPNIDPSGPYGIRLPIMAIQKPSA